MFSGQRYKDYEKPGGKILFSPLEKIFVFTVLETFCFDIGKFFLCLVAIYLMLTFAQKQNMTETIAYIKESLRDLYPSSEVSSLVRLIMERVCNIQPHHFLFCKDKELPESEKSRIHDIVERLKQMDLSNTY